MTSRSTPSSPWRFLVALVAIGMGAYAWYTNDGAAENRTASDARSPTSVAETRREKSPTPGDKVKDGAGGAATKKKAEAEPSSPAIIKNVTIKDQDGKVVYRGSIDLQPTLDRIAAGKRLSFRNDGIVFQNREGRLPKKEPSFYHEWVHPTKDVGGPGPQRVVTGQGGEVYYTHDHYRTFQKIAVAKPRGP